jgi:TPR repeat protein
MPQAVHQTAPAPAQEAHQTEPTPGASTDTPSAQPEQAEMIQPLAAEDVATYLEKGEEKVAAGDLAAARLFFERVARSGDPRGALAMAKTFDPNVLSALPIIGGKADPEAARSWYERAKSMQASL